MSLNTKGLIIKEQNVGERDKLVTVLTADMGIIRAFVRGAKSVKSNKQSATGLLSYSELTMYEGRDAYVIDDAKPVEVFFGLRNDIEKLALAQYFAELAFELAPKESGAGEYLRVILNCLYFLANGKYPPAKLKAIAELRLLSLSGYMPNLVACDKCGEYESNTMYFNFEHGLLYCENCAGSEIALPIPLEIISAMRHIVFAELAVLFEFSLPDESYEELSYITETYLKTKTDRAFRTLDFYKSLRNT